MLRLSQDWSTTSINGFQKTSVSSTRGTDLSVGGGCCRKCWGSDSELRLLVWAPGSEAQTGSGWGWLDESDSGPGRAGCGETASGSSPSGSRWCWCACLRTRGTMGSKYIFFFPYVCIYMKVYMYNGYANGLSTEWPPPWPNGPLQFNHAKPNFTHS